MRVCGWVGIGALVRAKIRWLVFALGKELISRGMGGWMDGLIWVLAYESQGIALVDLLIGCLTD